MKIIFHFIVCFLILFTGCRSRVQYVPIESKAETSDSVVTRDSTVIVLDDKGNVIRTELYREKERFRELNSDHILLQAKYDSLLNAKQKVVQVPCPVERELTNWEEAKMNVGGWAISVLSGLLLLGIGYVIIWLIKKRR